MPRRRNLLGHLRNEALRRQQQIERGLLNAERAPVRAEQVFLTPEEARRKRNRRYQNYFAGPAPVVDPPSGIPGVMLALADFGAEQVYVLRFNGEWELIATPSAELFPGTDGGSNSTPSWVVKTPAGHYLLCLDVFADLYPNYAYLSEDGITWTPVLEDIDVFDDNGAAEDADGVIWSFKANSTHFQIYREGSVVFTAPGPTSGALQYALQHIITHPTTPGIVACAGWRFNNFTGSINDFSEPWVVVSPDGESWVSTVLPDNRMAVQTSFDSLNLRFLPNGRLVYLTLHETAGILGETGPDGLRIWYADAPYSSWTEVNESSLWDAPADDDDWEGGPLTGGLTGTSPLFFVGHITLGLLDVPHAFMSTDAETWVEIEAPPVKIVGICYDEVADVLYGLTQISSAGGIILLRMLEASSGSGSWEDVTAGIPVGGTLHPYVKQAIWRL